MNHSLGYGTSSGDLNTGGNLSESSFLEALFGLEFGHADDAVFLVVIFLMGLKEKAQPGDSHQRVGQIKRRNIKENR